MALSIDGEALWCNDRKAHWKALYHWCMCAICQGSLLMVFGGTPLCPAFPPDQIWPLDQYMLYSLMGWTPWAEWRSLTTDSGQPRSIVGADHYHSSLWHIPHYFPITVDNTDCIASHKDPTPQPTHKMDEQPKLPHLANSHPPPPPQRRVVFSNHGAISHTVCTVDRIQWPPENS